MYMIHTTDYGKPTKVYSLLYDDCIVILQKFYGFQNIICYNTAAFVTWMPCYQVSTNKTVPLLGTMCVIAPTITIICNLYRPESDDVVVIAKLHKLTLHHY